MTVPAGSGEVLVTLKRPIDATALQAFNRCPRLYDLSMRRHYHAPGLSPALAYGSLWHIIMEQHYRTNGDRIRVGLEARCKWEPSDAADDYRSLERGLLEYDNYLGQYGKPEDKPSELTLGYPENPLLEVAANLIGAGLLYPYAGKLDRIFTEDGLYYVEDHKTTSRLEKNWFEKYKLSQQMMGYAFLASLLIGHPVAGVRINLHVVRKNDSVFERHTVTYSSGRIEEWLANTNATLLDLQQAETLNRFRGVYTDGGCSGKYGMCGFAPVCSVNPRVQQAILDQKYEIRVWDPLSSDEVPTD